MIHFLSTNYNKTLIGRYDDGKLIIPLHDDSDILYFKGWIFESRGIIIKKDYVRNFDYKKVGEYGTLFNCFPIMDLNDEFVELVYDWKENDIEI